MFPAELPLTANVEMEFRIANSFTDSLVRLTGEERRLVKTTSFDLQFNPVSTGMSN